MVVSDDDEDNNDNDYDPNVMSDVKTYLRKSTNWDEIVEAMLMKRDMKQLENLNFDFLHECCNSFHVFIPLKMSMTNWSDPTSRAVMHWCEMLKMSGINTLPAEEIAKRKGKEGLYACTCPMYMHYLVCEHTLQLYMKTGI